PPCARGGEVARRRRRPHLRAADGDLPMNRKHLVRAAGVTLIEMTIAATLFAALVAAVVSATNSGLSTWSNATIGAELQTKANRAMEQILAALSPAGASTLLPDPVPPTGQSTFTFKRCT